MAPLRVVSLLVLSLLPACFSQPVLHPINWLQQCRDARGLSIPAMSVLPGGGWDNLRNLEMSRVMNITFLQCRITEDGLYIIPDEVFVIPRKQAALETNSEIISSWLEHSSATSFTINVEGSYKALNGKFSFENKRVKIHQVRESSATSRVQVRNFLYTVKAYPDFTLDSHFVRRVDEIADAIKKNQTRQAAYNSERMVLDYGTHVITSVDAGAILMKEDYLHSSYISDSHTSRTSVSTSAAASFFKVLKIDFSWSSTSNEAQQNVYDSNITYSLIESHGGALFFPGITLEKWQESIRNNLVGIDRSGLPLHYFITTNSFPSLSESIVDKVVGSVSQAIERYYEVNTRPGCVDANSKNFNFQANVDDRSCEGPATNLNFGGVYQRCTKISQDADPLCQALAQKNPDTGDYTCRPPYHPTQLRSEETAVSSSQYECHSRCRRCGFLYLRKCCSQQCGHRTYVRTARIDTFWCSTKEKPKNSGYLFGGFYGPSLKNPLTKSKSCPESFVPLTFLSGGLKICLSNDYETGTKYSVPFGGLFSCESANPLAWDQQRCPPGFSQHLATISDGCQILYCVKSGLFTEGQLLPVILPPFTEPPLVSENVVGDDD